VCQGNDGRLSDSRAASDVSAWAKAGTKPSYSVGEVSGAAPTASPTFTGNITLPGGKWETGGNVGIGTTTPGAMLHINKNAAVSVAVDLIRGSSVDSNHAYYAALQVQRGGSEGQGLNFIVTSDAGAPFEAMRIGENGCLGVGCTPTEMLDIQNAAGVKSKLRNTAGGFIQAEISSNATSVATLSFTNSLALSGGPVTCSSTLSATDVTATSDERLKENVRSIFGALGKVLRLRGVGFQFRDDSAHAPRLGLIAQEVQREFPEVVHAGEDGMLSVSYGSLVGALVEAIKAQQVQIDAIRNRPSPWRRFLRWLRRI
jgi:hypothetical protein